MQHNNKIEFILTQRTKIIQAETKLRTLYDRFCLKFTETVDRIGNIFINLQQQQQQQQQENENQQKGLTASRIRTFQLFTADVTHVGDQ